MALENEEIFKVYVSEMSEVIYMELFIVQTQRVFSPIYMFDIDSLFAANGCGLNNGGCSHLCLNRPHPQPYVCACPMGLELLKDGRTCIVPEAFLLFTR